MTVEQLEEEIESLKERIEELEESEDELSDEVDSLKDENKGLQETLDRLEGFELDVSTLDKEMLFDWIKQNWDRMRLEDLQNIYP